ncbi:hypothetical protein JCM3765_003038 [Sporobolomyces pararoseus]
MTTSFTHQVGGHPSTILSSPLSSSTLIKPASSTELDFYQSLGPSLANGEFMREWCPAFYGTLRLQGKVNGNEEGNNELNDETAPSEMLVLENLTHKFRKPNVLDIKLGQILYDEQSASSEKIEKMKKAAEMTTSGELGLRLTGFQVWDSSSETYIQTSKPFGRTLLPSELDLGISRFFYPPFTSLTSAEQQQSQPLSSKDKDELPIPPESFPPPLPTDLILPILRTLLHRLKSLSKMLSIDQDLQRLRMIGTSLLIIIEGDPQVLEKSLLRAIQDSTTPLSAEEEEEEEEEEEMDEEGNAMEDSLIPFEIKLIDFAHTTLSNGVGGNEISKGVLKGVENFKDGLKRLVEKLEKEEERGKEVRN